MQKFLLRVCALLLCLSWPAFGQSANTPIRLDPVEVTGTRLGRKLEDSPINFTVVSRAEIEQAGRARLGELLRELPEFPGNPISDLVAFNSARGVMAADLRGLGSGNTLVLVNGRRATVNANPFDLITTYVDMNRFSPSLVERIEILKSGASAIYGADAVGGVINILTRRQPSGGEATVSYGNTFVHDAAELSASLGTGATYGRLGVSVGVDFSKRNAQAHRDRSFSSTSNLIPRYIATYDYFAKLPADQLAAFDGRALGSANARVSVAPGQVNGLKGVNIPGLAAGAAITALPGTAGGGLASATPSFSAPYRTATGGQFTPAAAATFVTPELTRGDPNARNLFNYNDYIWTTPEAERVGFLTRLDYELSARAAWFAELAGGRHRSHTEFHARDFTVTVPRVNAFNPFGVDVVASWRLPDAGPRRSLTEDDNFSAQTGLRGQAGTATRWEVAATYSRDEFIDVTRNVYDAAKVNAALASSNPATALNPFGGRDYRQDPTLIESLKTEAWFGGVADLLILDAQASAPLVKLPAGPLQGVVFVEYRKERFSAVSDASYRTGNILGYGQSGADVAFSRNVRALAAEIHAPLWAAAPGERSGPRLAVEAAARTEEFSASFRSGFKPSLGAVFRPVRDLTLRISQAWTFRAPTLPQLFSPQSEGYYNSVPDLRRPVALTGDDFDGPNVSRLVRQGGNPDLSAETGRVLQTGAIWTPRPVPGLSLEATWFRYELEDLISGVGPIYVLQNELAGLGSLVHRQAGSETYVNRTANPIPVLSGPAGQTTMVAPGQSTTVPGRLSRIDIFTVNLSRRQLFGWDFAARQALDVMGGRATAVGAVTYTDKNQSAYDRATPFFNGAGSSSSPRWRGRASLDWARRPWTLGATMSYIASSGYHEPYGGYQKPYRVVHLRASYTAPARSWIGRTQFSLGVEDVFNETPPLFTDPPIGFNYGQVARPQGRFWRATVKRSW